MTRINSFIAATPNSNETVDRPTHFERILKSIFYPEGTEFDIDIQRYNLNPHHPDLVPRKLGDKSQNSQRSSKVAMSMSIHEESESPKALTIEV